MNDQVGWACGLNGIINRTTDGGKVWSRQESNTEASLFSLFWINDFSLIAVGDSGVILKTIDGGNNWTKLSSNTNNTLRSVYFVDYNNGWAVGDNGTILQTDNGGLIWNTQTPDIISNLRSVHFIDYNTGYIAGDKGRGYKTTNGGVNWESEYFGFDYMFNCITFINEDTGWVFSSNREIFCTTDKGESWNKQTGVGNYDRIYSACFIDKVGYAVGNYGWIINTTDGGLNWQRQYVTNNWTLSVPLYSVNFINKYFGWAVGGGGIVLRTTDGGNIFTTAPLISDVSAGSNSLPVETNYRFHINDQIIINPAGSTEESNTVIGFGSLILQTPLQYNHSTGELVVVANLTSIEIEENPLPDNFYLYQNYPNPFNPGTKIRYTIPTTPASLPLLTKEGIEGRFVTLKVYDLLGREVATLVDEYKPAGTYEVEFDVAHESIRAIASGIYFYQLKVADASTGSGQSIFQTKKMILLK